MPPPSTFRIADQLHARCADGPLEVEAILFNAGAPNVATTVKEARGRLGRSSLTPTIVSTAASSVERATLASYARADCVRAVLELLGPCEIFQGRVFDRESESYEGVWIDLKAIAADVGVKGAGLVFQGLHVVSLMEEMAPHVPLTLENGGTGQPARVAFLKPQKAIYALGSLKPREPRARWDDEDKVRDELARSTRDRALAAASDATRARMFAIERTLARIDVPASGPLSDLDAWTIERQLVAGDPRGARDRIEKFNRDGGDATVARYLRAHLALIDGSEPPQKLAERLLAEKRSGAPFFELQLLKARAWQEAQQWSYAKYFARPLVDDPAVPDRVALAAHEILEKAQERGTPSARPSAVRRLEALDASPNDPAVSPSPVPSPPPPGEEAAGEPLPPLAKLLSQTQPVLRGSRSSQFPRVRGEAPRLGTETVRIAGSGHHVEGRAPDPAPVATGPKLGTETLVMRSPAAGAAPFGTQTARLDADAASGATGSGPHTQRTGVTQTMIVVVAGSNEPPESAAPETTKDLGPPSSVAPPMSVQGGPSSGSIDVEMDGPASDPIVTVESEVVANYDSGEWAAVKPYRPDPPRMTSAPVVDRGHMTDRPPPMTALATVPRKVVGSPAISEDVETLSLPAGLTEDMLVEGRPARTVEDIRIVSTRLARTLARDYRALYQVTLRTDPTAIEWMQKHLLSRYAGHKDLESPEIAWDLRRHGALLSEILARMVGAYWIDVRPSDLGYWAMFVPPRTRTWPFGRVHRFVALGHRDRDLVSYYLALVERARGD